MRKKIPTISATDLIDEFGNVIPSTNFSFYPSVLSLSANEPRNFTANLTIPLNSPAGNYKGSIIITAPEGTLNVEVTVTSLFVTNLPNVELISADPTVTSIIVTRLNLSEINETYKPEECITPQSAYMVNSTGAGNFTLKFTDIPNANTIIVYKINATNQWIELDATTTADTVTFTMSVENPSVVFCSGAPPVAARVPILTPIGIIALIGLLSIIAIGRIGKKEK